MSDAKNYIVLVADFEVKPGCDEEFEKIALGMQENTNQNETGTLFYQLTREKNPIGNNKGKIIYTMLEVYKDKQGKYIIML